MKIILNIPLLLELETYENRCWQSVTYGKSGIYILYLKNKVVYVGRSKDIGKRLMSHCVTEHEGKDYFDAFSIFPIKDIKLQCLYEIILIDMLNPTLNLSYGGEPLVVSPKTYYFECVRGKIKSFCSH